MSRLLRSLSIFFVAFLGCSQPLHAEDIPKPKIDLPAPTKKGELRTAVFAGGCFWCTEAVFEQLKGVTDVVSGYAGGTKETAIYEVVGSGTTNHAESIKITYDPSVVTYGDLLRVFFFAAHDPTTKDRQGPDWGHQYRGAIFYENEDQKKVAQAYIKQLEDAKVFSGPIVTTVEPLDKGFFPAEDYHQNFVTLNPTYPYVVRFSTPKVKKTREHFKDLVKPLAE